MRLGAAAEVVEGRDPRQKRRIIRWTQAGALDPHAREGVQIHQAQREIPPQETVAVEMQRPQVGQVPQLGRDHPTQVVVTQIQLRDATIEVGDDSVPCREGRAGFPVGLVRPVGAAGRVVERHECRAVRRHAPLRPGRHRPPAAQADDPQQDKPA